MIPDVAPPLFPSSGSTAEPGLPAQNAFESMLGQALDAASSALAKAGASESAFAAGRGGIQEMVVDRAQADVLLAIASTSASRFTQSVATLLNMQV